MDTIRGRVCTVGLRALVPGLVAIVATAASAGSPEPGPRLPDIGDPGAIAAAGRDAAAPGATAAAPEVGVDRGGDEPETVASSPDEDRLAAGGSPAAYEIELTEAAFLSANSAYLSQGKKLVDIEVRDTGGSPRFSGVWYPVSGTIHTLIHDTPTAWSNFISQVTPLAGRWLDVEVGYYAGSKRYSAIFYEDGDDYGYAVHTTTTDAQFQGYLDTYLASGRSLIDFEAYRLPDGTTRFAGIWVNDPNQPRTHLFYNLESPDVSDLLSPMHGRVIDVERYYSDLHGADRWAVLLAMYPGGEWGVLRNLTASALDSYDTSINDSNTHLIDLDPEIITSGALRFNAVWGDTYSSLHEVDAINSDIDPEARGTAIDTLLSQFESISSTTDFVGIYAKNLRTNQSISYRGDEMFYLASAAKVPIHIRLWQEIAAGRIDRFADAMFYMQSLGSGQRWYVNEDTPPGFGTWADGTGGSSNDVGQLFSIDRFDRGMMNTSDNAATSALVDDTTYGVAWDSTDLNEWLSAVPDVGQGWGLVTSIHDVDRAIVWQGQQTSSNAAGASYFLAPGFTFGPRSRNTFFACTVNGGNALANCLGSNCTRCDNNNPCPAGESCQVMRDPFGDLRSFFGISSGTSLPAYSPDTGRSRYFAQGLNSATPRAFGNLLERFVENAFMSSGDTQNALNNVGEFDVLSNGFPFGAAPTSVFSKGGTKGNVNAGTGVCTDSSIVRMGGDDLVMVMLTRKGTRSCTTIRANFTGAMGGLMLQRLTANLENPGAGGAVFAPTTIRPGETASVIIQVANDGGGDAGPFDVDFYLSSNTTISTSDILIATDRVTGGIDGYQSGNALTSVPLPDIPPGDYYFGWVIDQALGSTVGEVPEWDERDASNVGFLADPVRVKAPLVPVENLQFASPLSASWDAVADADFYRVREGVAANLPALLDGADDSCILDSTTTNQAEGLFTRTPLPGQFFWYLIVGESDGPLQPATAGPRSADGPGFCGTSCAHSTCDTGDPLDPVCDTCVAQICDLDPYCCTTSWDSVCQGEVVTICGSLACGGGQGACVHPLCEAGPALTASCDSPPLDPSCVDAICEVDPYCCDTAWDSVCIGEVTSICGLSCD